MVKYLLFSLIMVILLPLCTATIFGIWSMSIKTAITVFVETVKGLTVPAVLWIALWVAVGYI